MVKEKAVGEIERLIGRRRAHVFLSGDTFVALRTVSLAYIITGICHVRGWLKKKKREMFQEVKWNIPGSMRVKLNQKHL